MGQQNKRRHPRVSSDIKITIRTSDGETFPALAVENISLGGVFIHMDPPIGFGTELQLEFGLKNPSRQIRCKGFVVWNRKEKNVEGGPGIGIRLTDISIGDMRALETYIQEQLKNS